VPGEPPAPHGASDEELLARVGARERDAFEGLYRRYVRPVFGLALHRLGDRRDAEEATEEAFAAVWRSASAYRAESGAAGAWLYTVAGSAIAERLRRRGTAGAGVLPEPADRTDESVAWRVHRALAELAPRERELIELAYWSGLSQTDLAGYLGLSPGAVETRVCSALARLAPVLAEESP